MPNISSATLKWGINSMLIGMCDLIRAVGEASASSSSGNGIGTILNFYYPVLFNAVL